MRFAVKVMDKEFFQSDEHKATVRSDVSYTTAMKAGEAVWKSAYMRSGSYQ